MGIRKTPRFLAGVSAIAMLGAAGCGEEPAREEAASQSAQPAAGTQDQAATDYRMAGEGEGEGAGGNAGGEFGIDPQAALNDPVVYLTALEVMRAHYLAGLAALEAGERAAGAEMLAHPISEIYVDLEPVLAERGVDSFMDTLTAASVAPYEGASDEEIEARVAEVLAAIDRAEQAAPEADDWTRVRAKVLADLIERAALQYEFAAREQASGDAYLDGYGFTVTAQNWADEYLAQIEADHAGFAGEARTVLGFLSDAFPGPVRPEELTVPAGDVLAANEAVQSELPDQ